MTLEELEAYVLALSATVSNIDTSLTSLESNYGATISQINSSIDNLDTTLVETNKEVAVLKGRVDELEANSNFEFKRIHAEYAGPTSPIFIDIYDLESKTVKSTMKLLQMGLWIITKVKGVTDDDSLLITTPKESVLLEDSNITGVYPTLKIQDTGDVSFSGADLITGGGVYNKKTYTNAGVLPTERGSILQITKQRVS